MITHNDDIAPALQIGLSALRMAGLWNKEVASYDILLKNDSDDKRSWQSAVCIVNGKRVIYLQSLLLCKLHLR